MNPKQLRVLYWAPRVLGVLFVLFISLFALDVFGEGYGFWDTLLALFMHLIPSYILVGILVLAWRREWIGAVASVALAVFYLVWARGQHWTAYLFISGPLFVNAGLWLWNWLKRDAILAVRSSNPKGPGASTPG